MIKAVVLLALVCAIAQALPKWHELDGYKYKDFAEDTQKPYAHGSAIYKHREAIFEDRLSDIRRHNADKSQTYKRGVNQFSDWTAEEFKDYQRARPNYKPTTLEAKRFGDAGTEIPRFVDYRLRTNPAILTGVKNQGSCGSCWAHSATESMESYFAIRYGQLPVLSTQQVASCTLTMNGCGGGSFVAGWEAMAATGGLNEEWTYPYVDFFAPEMSWNNTQRCMNISKKFPTIHPAGKAPFAFTWWPKANISGYTRVHENNATALMRALALAGPQSISVAASYQWSDYESGVLVNNYAQNATWQEINHDVQLVGYGYDSDLNMNYWIVRNSWGTNYGEEGYIRLNRPEVEPCGFLAGYEVCGTSGVLSNPGYPHITDLKKKNGYYF